jgi:hypothetical protein
MALKIIGDENDANPVLPVRELDLNRGNFIQAVRRK